MGAIDRESKEQLKKREHNKRNAQEKRKREVQCMNMLRAKTNCIMGKNSIHITALTIYNLSHSPRMYETLLKCLRMQCMSTCGHINKTQTKDFIKNSKTPKIS